MSFLKIGDRAAGAIKSGGTTRRAAKMVICRSSITRTYRSISSTGRLKEEQKVAALVDRFQDRHEEKLNALFEGHARQWDGTAEVTPVSIPTQ